MTRVLRTVLTLAAGMLIATLLVEGRPRGSTAQDASPLPGGSSAITPTPEPTQPATTFLLANVTLEEVPDGAVVINVATVILAPGASTQPFANPGPTILAVQEGTITLDAELASVGNALVTDMIGVSIATPPPGLVTDLVVRQNQQVVIPANARAEFRNDGEANTRLMVLSLVPSPEPTAEG